jgi:hypothetical protein
MFQSGKSPGKGEIAAPREKRPGKVSLDSLLYKNSDTAVILRPLLDGGYIRFLHRFHILCLKGYHYANDLVP